MSKHSKDEWLHDIDVRQRNIVFPDTAENEGRFWRNASGQPLTETQWIGVSLMWVAVLVCLTTFWPRGHAPWWQKLVDGYLFVTLVTVGFVAFIEIGNRRARRHLSKH